MRQFINWITGKIKNFLGTAPLRSISQDLMQVRTLVEQVSIDQYLNEHLFKNEKYAGTNRLGHFHQSVFAQNGEDGIIAEIFSRIGVKDHFFVEFGVHGVKNNSTLLLVKGWQGLWLGGDAYGEQIINRRFNQVIKEGRLRFSRRWITAENIESIFLEHNIPLEFDFLSIDIDGNDYWIWNAIEKYRPRVVCIEYNASFPADVYWIMQYNQKHQWDGSSYFGASLKALELLGAKKGYVLIACDFTGCNAFFVRNDEALEKFHSPFQAETHYEPPRYFLSKPSGHLPGFGPFISK